MTSYRSLHIVTDLSLSLKLSLYQTRLGGLPKFIKAVILVVSPCFNLKFKTQTIQKKTLFSVQICVILLLFSRNC